MNSEVDVIVVGSVPLSGWRSRVRSRWAAPGASLLERRADQPEHHQAFAVHARTLESLDARGLADELCAGGCRARGVAGPRAPRSTCAASTAATRWSSSPAERHRAAAGEAGRRAGRRDRAGARGPACTSRTGRRTRDRARRHASTRAYVVGCDGAHSTVRGLLGSTSSASSTQRTSCSPTCGCTTRPRWRCSPSAAAAGWSSSCRSATAGSGRSPGTGCASRCRSTCRCRWRRCATRSPHRGDRLRHARAAVEQPVPQRAAGRPAATGSAGRSSRATPRTCTRRMGAQGMNTGIGTR
jgi:2-polyprenyl-6-methoxyphenol hydroxylase-like FAD-dependent oxidoreductase